jgi:hypothetical protein
LIVMQRNCSPLTSRNLIPPLAMQLHQWTSSSIGKSPNR